MYEEARIDGVLDFVQYLIKNKHKRAGEFQKLSVKITQKFQEITDLDPKINNIKQKRQQASTTDEYLDILDDIDAVLDEMDILNDEIDEIVEEILEKALEISPKYYQYAYMLVLQHHVKWIKKEFPNISTKEMVKSILPYYSDIMQQEL